MSSSDERRPSGLASAAKQFITRSSDGATELPSGHYYIIEGSWEHTTKLKIGDKIQVIGMPLIGGLDGGQYKVIDIRTIKRYGWCYEMKKYKARKAQLFKVLDIDGYINVRHMTVNRIDIVK